MYLVLKEIFIICATQDFSKFFQLENYFFFSEFCGLLEWTILASIFDSLNSICFFYGDVWKQLCRQPNLIC